MGIGWSYKLLLKNMNNWAEIKKMMKPMHKP
jgi:hypothetical protein